MLVSHRHKFIYTKTGKTAGTSVEHYFEPFCVAEGTPRIRHGGAGQVSEAGIIGFRGPNRPRDRVWWHHMPAVQIKRLLGDEIWNAYFKFCVIRNPYEKVISLFYFLRKHARIKTNPKLSDRAQFQHWLLHGRLWLDRNKYAIDGEFCLDDVIKHEQLASDMERICARIGVPWNPAALPKLKGGVRPASANIDNMYSAETAEVVRKRYVFEFVNFGYAEDLAAYRE